MCLRRFRAIARFADAGHECRLVARKSEQKGPGGLGLRLGGRRHLPGPGRPAVRLPEAFGRGGPGERSGMVFAASGTAENSLDNFAGQGLTPDEASRRRGADGLTVGSVVGQGVPDIARRDQGREGREVCQAVRVTPAVEALMVMGDRVEDGPGAVRPQAPHHLGAGGRMPPNKGEFVRRQGAGRHQKRTRDSSFSDVVYQPGSVGFVRIHGELKGAAGRKLGHSKRVQVIGLLPEQAAQGVRNELSLSDFRHGFRLRVA